MFGRSKAPAALPTEEPTPAKAGGKGRPTPTRRQAEARNRHPLVGTPQLRADATKEERKAARSAQRRAQAEERSRRQQGMRDGDPRYLGPRDAGPARAWVRDYVDARRNLAEYLLPGVLVILALSLIPNRTAAVIGTYVMYLVIVVVIVDVYLLRRRVTRLVTERFGAEEAKGVARYTMMRVVQMRMSRTPKARVARGQFPT